VHVGARRRPDEKADARQGSGHGDRLVGGDLEAVLDERLIEDLRHEVAGQAQRLETLDARESLRNNGGDTDIGARFLQPAADAGERAPGADPGDEGSGRPPGRQPDLFEDLRAGGVVVSLPVVVVGVLVGVPVAVRFFGGEPLCLEDGGVIAFHRIGGDDLGTVRDDTGETLAAGVCGNHQGHADAGGGAEHRIGDAGVAGRRIEQASAVVEVATADGGDHHSSDGAVLDRAARVELLQLGEQPRARRQPGQVGQLDERRVTDGGGEVVDHV